MGGIALLESRYGLLPRKHGVAWPALGATEGAVLPMSSVGT